MAVPFGPVQSAFAATTGAATATTPGMTTTPGNLLVVVVTSFGNHIGATPVTDSKGNAWTQAVGSTGSGTGFCAMYYAENCLGGAGHTATFTPTASDFTTCTMIEVSGAALSSSLSTSAMNTGSTSPHTAGPITANAVVPELFIGAGSESAGVPTLTNTNPAQWYTVLMQPGSSTEGAAIAFRLVSPSVSDSFSYNGPTVAEGKMIVGFKAAASSGGGSTEHSHTFVGA